MTHALRIAIVHYHLRPGGVATVIKEAVRALRELPYRVVALSGAPIQPVEDLPEHVGVEGLNYADRAAVPKPDVLVERLKVAAAGALGGAPDLWHFHNHSLGKNWVLSAAVYRLAASGQRLLLQIHDFPEDGRPSNYRELLAHLGDDDAGALGERLYPQAPHVHYATLNVRDRDFLCRAGAAPSRVHLLPNAVSMSCGAVSATDVGARLFLYPTRSIRRKNLGEFLLWSAFGGKGDRFATTLAPTSEIDLTPYRQWVNVAGSLGLPAEFEVGLKSKAPFATLLASAQAVVTTSVGEGFGLAFLEPWLVDRPLVGRDLPELTNAFKEQGLNLDGMYKRLLVPLAWVGAEALRSKIAIGMKSMFAGYGRTPGEDAIARAFASAVEADRVDFGRLDEPLQESVIRRIVREPACRREIESPPILTQAQTPKLIAANRRVVESEYDGKQYGRRLARIYGAIMDSKIGMANALRAESLLDSFLAPQRFFLLRS